MHVVDLVSEYGMLRLGVESNELRVLGLESHGRSLDVKGSEFSVIPRGHRYPIDGWHFEALSRVADPASVTRVLAEQSGWRTRVTPVFADLSTDSVAVSSVTLPAGLLPESIELIVGGWDAYSWNKITVLVDGVSLAVREHSPGEWADPLRVRIPPTSRRNAGRRTVEVVLLLEGAWARNTKLDAVDPNHLLSPSIPAVWPAQFEQYLEVEPVSSTHPALVRDLRPVEGPDGGGAVAELEVAGRRIQLSYEWAWGGRALIRRGMVGTGADLPVRWIDHGLWESSARPGHGGAGEPVGLGDFAVRGLMHPAGWSRGGGNTSRLIQYTARGRLESLHTACTLFAKPGESTDDVIKDFLTEHSHRGKVSDKDRTIFGVDGFGSWVHEPPTAPSDRPYAEILDDEPEGELAASDIQRVRGWSQSGVNVDYYSIDFYTGYAGEYGEAALNRLPGGFDPLVKDIEQMGATAGIWLDTCFTAWSVGDNTKFAADFGHVEPFTSQRSNLCLASEPYRSSFSAGLDRLIDQGIGAFKFDNFQAHCHAPHHDHLPGVHANEAFVDAAMGILGRLRRNSPDVLLHLYWGYRSPWWMLWASTLFDPGFATESAHPFVHPSRSLRTSTVHGVNIATLARPDLPRFCKDSLGTWLSNWKWNSAQGHRDWRVAFAFDIIRANQFLQIWTGEEPLSTEDLNWVAEIQNVLRDNPDLFDRSYGLGSLDTSAPSPYALVTRSASRTVGLIGIHNPAWIDMTLEFDSHARELADAGLTIVAGGGVHLASDGRSLMVEAQAMCVLAAASSTWPMANRGGYTPMSEGLSPWAAKLVQSERAHNAELPALSVGEEQQAALMVQLFREDGRHYPVDAVEQLAVLQGVRHSQAVAEHALDSSWQVFLIDGPVVLSNWSLEMRGDLMGAHSAKAQLVVLPKATVGSQ